MGFYRNGAVELFSLEASSENLLEYLHDPRTGRYYDVVQAAPQPWPAPASGTPLTMALLDTGVMHQHPRLQSNIINEIDFTGEGTEDLHGHGSVVALIFYATTKIANPMLVAKIAGKDGTGDARNLIRALDWVGRQRNASGHEIVTNISAGVFRRRWWGFRACNGTCDVCRAAVRAAESGMTIIAAVGNTAGKVACPATVGVVKGHSVIPVAEKAPVPDRIPITADGPT